MDRKLFLAVIKGLTVIILLNLVASYVYTRFDLTEDQRYTLSEESGTILEEIESPVIIDVLLEGELPPEFLKLKTETRQILEEYASSSDLIKYNFVNPLEDDQNAEATIAQLQSIGLTPANITVEENNRTTQELLFPWALVTYKDRTVRVPLLKNQLGASTEDRINSSVQNLEYAFSDALYKLKIKEKKRIAVIKGNGQLEDMRLADFLTTVRDYYNIGAITLDSVAGNPQKVLDQLNTYDLAIIAKPTQAFTDVEKYVLDQFIVHGGKSLWLLDPVAIEMDSLLANQGRSLAFPRDLNLKDFFFKFGLRLNSNLVSDLYFTQIVLASGEGNNTEYNPVPWYYYPMVFSRDDHPVNTNLEALRFQFTSSIDTLSSPYQTTVLLSSSPLSKLEGVPREIDLEMIRLAPDKDTYNAGPQPLSVLVEGAFKSAFVNRVKPAALNQFIESGPENKMIVIADGDFIKNQMRNGRPLELGYDKWTNNFYGNKEFLINCVNYLLDDTGLINVRGKEVAIPLMDQEKIVEQRSKWQLINIGGPVLATLLFGFLFGYLRKRKYAK